MACASAGIGHAQTLNIGQYTHTAWRIRDGFASARIVAIAQTPDGYLWLGTARGLLRFDGIGATPWRSPRGPQLSNVEIGDLLVARDSTLWIGTARGLFTMKNGRVEEYSELSGVRITKLLERRDGTVWLGTFSPARLCTVRARSLTCDRTEGLGVTVMSLFEDRKGSLWVATANGVWRWAPGPPAHAYVVSPKGPEVGSLAEDESGALLMGTTAGLKVLSNGKVRDDPLPQIKGPSHYTLFRARDGALWIATNEGLLHVHSGRVDRFGVADGLSGSNVSRVFEDAEGNLWANTDGGLDRFRVPAITTLGREEGLTGSVWSVQSTSDGIIWIGGPQALQRQVDGRIESVPGLAGSARPLGLDQMRRLVAATDKGVSYLERGRFNAVAGIPSGLIFAVAGDSRRHLWILNAFEGLFLVVPDSGVRRFDVGGTTDPPTTLLPDEGTGGAWIGHLRGRLTRITRQGQPAVSYTTADGLGAGRIVDLRRGSDSSLWISTEGGLSRMQNGRITTLTEQNGLPCDAVNWAIEDDDRALWVNLPCGLVRIAHAEIDGWVRNPERRVALTAFDADDGAVPMGSVGSVGPHVTKAPDGRIWFGSVTGLSVIDPRHLRVNRVPPPVHVERIVADGEVYDTQSAAGRRLSLPPRIRNLAIDYAGLSLVAPEKTRFRFRLDGQDTGWREVVNQRHVEYSNLRPGSYRFHVTAANNSGVWSTQGTTVDFSITPAFSQTNWFRGLVAAGVVGMLWAAYRLRIRELRLREERFRETIETMPALAFIALPNGERTFWNRRWTEYTGLTPAQAAGSGWQQIVHPDDLRSVLAKWDSAVATGQPLEYEVRLRGAGGEHRWFLTRAVPVKNRRGHVQRWYGVTTDIEDRKRAEQERERLRQLEAELAHVNRVSTLGELTASLAHEIRQPITATMTNANVTLRTLGHAQPDLDKLRQVAKRILRDSARAEEIITRLRSLYKKAPPKRELVDVCEIIREVVVLLQSEARRHLVSMRLDLATEPAAAIADRVQLQQVFLNLMLNGIEAMKDVDGGQLLVAARAEPPDVLLSVRDSGVGLPATSAGQLFAPFFTTKPNGTGMGLAICRSIVESHGGRLWATPNDDRGATFHFTLPAV